MIGGQVPRPRPPRRGRSHDRTSLAAGRRMEWDELKSHLVVLLLGIFDVWYQSTGTHLPRFVTLAVANSWALMALPPGFCATANIFIGKEND